MAERYDAEVSVFFDGQTVPAISIMGLMMLGAGVGAEVTLYASGRQAKDAIEDLSGLIEMAFHECD